MLFSFGTYDDLLNQLMNSSNINSFSKLNDDEKNQIKNIIEKANKREASSVSRRTKILELSNIKTMRDIIETYNGLYQTLSSNSYFSSYLVPKDNVKTIFSSLMTLNKEELITYVEIMDELNVGLYIICLIGDELKIGTKQEIIEQINNYFD